MTVRVQDTDLQRVYQRVREQLGAERLKQIANDNTISVRLPLEACEQIKQLALRHNTPRSRIVRQPVLEFIARHVR